MKGVWGKNFRPPIRPPEADLGWEAFPHFCGRAYSKIVYFHLAECENRKICPSLIVFKKFLRGLLKWRKFFCFDAEAERGRGNAGVGLPRSGNY